MSLPRNELLAILLLSTLLAACASALDKSLPHWNDEQQVVTVRLNSVPSGAQVYGVVGENAGTLIGTTPLTLRYYRHKHDLRVGAPIWCDQCGEAPSQETLIYLPTEQGWGDLLVSLTIFGRERCLVEFRSILVHFGYEPLLYRHELHSENKSSVISSGVNCWDDLKGRTITLTPTLTSGGE